MLDADPTHDCPLCPRLVAFRESNRRQYPHWHNAPVRNWGDPAARLMIVGLAPGLRGANATGRPFTGDYAGDLLFETLKRAGLATGEYRADPNDGFRLTGAVICNAVRCVPPQNKPIGEEITTCRRFLVASLDAYPTARVYLALGRIAHDSFLSAVGARRAGFPFVHGARHELAECRVLFDSFHCSRYNTNTGKLTTDMFENVVFAAAEAALSQPSG